MECRQTADHRSHHMTEPPPIIYSGRSFSLEELALMRQAASDYASLGITEISRTICEWLDWKRPNGRLKNHECRLLLERLRDKGFLALPALHYSGCRGPRSVPTDVLSDARRPIQTHVTELEPLRFTLVDATRFTGTCYRAANWICLGETSGRGRMDRHHRRSKLPKRIFVFPLHRRAQQLLCAIDPPAPSISQDE